jgi:hypothetical protein
MVWIARDNDGPQSPYRIFGAKPIRAKFVSYNGNVQETFTWTGLNPRYIGGTKSDYIHSVEDDFYYQPLSNEENTIIAEADCPIYLEVGEGPIEVKLVLKEIVPQRSFEGEGI